MPNPGPLEIVVLLVIDALRTRFANGDIDQAEFERLRSVLQRG